MNIYSKNIEYIEFEDSYKILFTYENCSIEILIDENDSMPYFFKKNISQLIDTKIDNQVLAHLELKSGVKIEVFIKDNNFIVKENQYMLEKPYFFAEIKNLTNEITAYQMSDTTIGLKDHNGTTFFEFNELLNNKSVSYNVPFETTLENKEIIFMPISYVSCERYHLLVFYDLYRREIKFKKVLIDFIYNAIDLTCELQNLNELRISYKSNFYDFKYNVKQRGKVGVIFDDVDISLLPNEPILAFFKVNGQKYFVHQKGQNILLTRNKPYYVLSHGVNLKSISLKNNLLFVGRFTHYSKHAKDKFNTIYLNDIDHPVATVKRPFSNIPLLKRLVYFNIQKGSLKINDKIHNNLLVGNEKFIVHNLKRKYSDKKVKTIHAFLKNNEVCVLRTTLGANLTITHIPVSPEYTFLNRLKISFAKFYVMFTKPFNNKHKSINLFFEKKSNKADESGFRVFEKVVSEARKNSDNYFILDSNHESYRELKEKYKNLLVAKYSFNHYVKIFRANYLISSELSNHLLNDRLYIDSLRNKIMKTPLIFLQHGIMFAKPVDNPMAFGFHKDKNPYNIYKSVISSDLEAEQFYKMNYSKKDLIKTGLATFDYAKLDQEADKIAFMPTYRYWEEGLIYRGEIQNTTYYNAIIDVIKKFEDHGLIDRLLIVPHNKFSEFIFDNMPEYAHIISTNPSDALTKSRIFITDYSSAIYDAIIRGAYPIFHWEEKEYLISNYKAIPPVDESNAPGPISYNTEELLELVKHAIKNNYVLEENYMEKYKKINEFSDGKNTKRIVEYLSDNHII